jgi:hypothetical protein
MTFRVNDQVTASLFIAGREFLLDTGNSLRTLHMRASSLQSLPELHVSFIDTLNQMPNYGLQDGAQITIQINSTASLTRNFRVYNWERHPAPQGFIFSLDCYWDAPRYWVGTSQVGIQGSSAQALKSIASTCGLTWDKSNDDSSDAMLWLPGNSTFAEFAKAIARAGYISDTSHMGLAVDSLGNMLYLDINQLPDPDTTVGYTPTSGSGKFLMITDFTPETKSGTNNMMGGYMHSRYVQRIDDDTSSVDSIENELSYTPDAPFPLLSADVRKRMVRGGISYGPIDFGNVHENYERAKYQNGRYNLLNSLSGEFLFPFQTDWEPFDNFNLALPADLGSTQYNGEYTVRDKIIFIQGTTYNEKIIAVKNGLGS